MAQNSISLYSQADAEEICTILQQAFQLVFTEATMEHLNSAISAGERESMFLAESPPKLQGWKLPQPKASKSPVRKQPHPRAKLTPGGSLES